MSKTIIAVRHFGLGGRESLETAVNLGTNCTDKYSRRGLVNLASKMAVKLSFQSNLEFTASNQFQM